MRVSGELCPHLSGDPCRLARQVNQFERLEHGSEEQSDPCRLARQVNQFERLLRPTAYAPAPKLIHL